MFLRKFFAALWGDWVVLMSGLASILLAFLAAFVTADTSVTQKLLLVAAVVCFIIAAYRVWVNEHRKRLELESTIKNTLLPDLKCKVLALDKHLLVKDGVKETVVTCIIEMRNLGAPSSVIGWKLIISSSEKPDISLVPCHFAADAINLANSGFTYQLNNEDAMLKKAITPIPIGGVVQGFLIFKTQIPKEELFAPGDKIELYFKDVRERLYSTGKGEISVNEANHALYFPGMNTKVIQPSPKKGKRKKVNFYCAISSLYAKFSERKQREMKMPEKRVGVLVQQLV